MPVNPLDEALASLDAEAKQGGGQQRDPFQDTLEQIDQEHQSLMKSAQVRATGTTPDRAAQVRNIAIQTGMSPDLVDRNFDDLSKRYQVEQVPYGAIQKDTPHVAQFISDPHNAALAKDDLENLGALEWLVTAPQRAFAQSINQLKFSALKTESIFRPLTQEEQDALGSYKFHQELGGQLGAGDSYFRKAITGFATLLPQIASTMFSAGKYGAVGAAEIGIPAAAVGSVVPGVGTAAAGLAGAGVGFRAGAAYGAMKSTFQLEAGGALDEYEKFRDEYGRPLDPSVIKAAAIAAGAANAGVELFGFEKLVESIPGLRSLTGKFTRDVIKDALKRPTVRAALGEMMKSYGTTLGAESLAEVAQRANTILFGELAKTQPSTQLAPGQLAPGNVNLYDQPSVKNPDGTTSTVDSVGVNVEGKEYLLPTVTPGGQHFTGPDQAEQAIAEFRKTGRHLGVFATPEASTAYAKQLHEDYAAGTYAGGDKFRSPSDVAQDLVGEFTGALSSFALGVAGGPVMDFAHHAQQARRASMNEKYFRALGEGVAQAKTSARAPDAVEQLITRAVDKGPLETIYAPTDTWRTYWQSQNVDPEQMADRVTGRSGALEEAEKTGTVLPIPTARYAIEIAPTPHNEFFARELKLEPGEQNTREAEAFIAQQQAAAQEAVQQAAADPNEQVFRQVRDSLVEGGKFVPDQADAIATLVTKGIGTLAGKAGFDPVERLQRYGLQINRTTQAEAAQRRQTATAGPEAGRAGTGAPATGDTALAAGATETGPAEAVGAPTPGLEALGHIPGLDALMSSLGGAQLETGGTEGLTTNASGESAASAEALSRQQGMTAKGDSFVVYDRAGRRRPLIGPDAVDYQARQGETYGVEGPTGFRVLDDRGGRAPSLTPATAAGDTSEQQVTNAKPERGAAGREDVQRGPREQPAPDEGGRAEGPGNGPSAERRRLPTSVDLAGEGAFTRAEPEADAKRLKPEVRREVERIVEELAAFPFVEKSWSWLGAGEGKTGNAAGGDANIVGGAAGAPVYNDVLNFAPLNKGRAGQELAKEVRGTRAQVAAAGQKVLDTNTITSNLAEGIVRIAERREADDFREITRPLIPPAWGTPVSEAFTNELSAAIDDAHASEQEASAAQQEEQAGAEGDTSFDTSEFGQSLMDLFNQEPTTTESGAPVARTDYLSRRDYDAQLRATYVRGDEQVASSRDTRQTAPIPPVGSWMIDDSFQALDGHEIEQLVEIPVDQLEITEDTGRAKFSDVEQYARWLQSGHEAPPLRVVQSDKGTLRTLDHRRLLAAKAAGQSTVKAWVSWATQSTRPGKPTTGLTYELAQRGAKPLDVVAPAADRTIFSDDKTLLEELQGRLQAEQQTATEKADVLATGELQPRLPGAGDVRELNVETPEFDLPFTLTSPVTKPEATRRREVAPSDDYLRARAEADAASRDFGEATRAFRAREIDDAAYLEARRVNDAAQVRFDAAYAREQQRKPTTLFQPFFHGSPHDFDKFSLKHIGTGEGAQTYGWGLYFAEAPDVAAGYYDRLAESPEVVRMKLGSMQVGPFNDFDYSRNAHVNDVENIRATLAEDLLADPLSLMGRGAGQFQQLVLEKLDEKIAAYRKEWPEGVTAAETLRRELAKKGAAVISFEKRKGGIYQVNIDEQHIAKMLDYDAPIDKQPAPVQEMVRERLKELKYLGPKDDGPRQLKSALRAYVMEHGGMAEGPNGGTALAIITQVEREKLALDLKEERAAIDAKYPTPALGSGRSKFEGPEAQADFVRWSQLAKQIADAEDEAPKHASMALLEAGVPGVKYLDAQSRDADVRKKTRNVVAFDDSIVTITHKDGTALTQQERDEFFQENKGEPRRGSIVIGPDRRIAINLFEKADASTIFHELGHFFLEVYGDTVEALVAKNLETLTDDQQRLIDDYRGLLAQLGVENRRDVTVDEHEKMARLFEQYIFEGKAPSFELRSVMARFRAWMLGIYRSLKGLNVKLTPEVKGIFDRMLASDGEIAAVEAADKLDTPFFLTPEAAGMSPERFKLYRSVLEDASQKAREELTLETLQEVRREQEAIWKAQRSEIAAQVESELHQQPVYQALAAMQRGTSPDGTPLVEGLESKPLKLSKALLLERVGAERLKALGRLRPYVYTVTGGADPDVIAKIFGYSSGDEMLQAIVTAPQLSRAVAEETDRRMLAEHGSMMLDGSLHERAQAAVANDLREQAIRMELRALWDLKRKVEPFVRQVEREAKQTARDAERERDYERRWFEAETKLRIALVQGRAKEEIAQLESVISELRAKARGAGVEIRESIPTRQTLETVAGDRVYRTRVRDLKPGLFWTAAQHASQQATERAGRQDISGAIEAKNRELLNLAIFRAMQTAQTDVDKRIKKARDYSKKSVQAKVGLAGGTFLEQLSGVLDRYEFAQVPQKVLNERADIRDWVEAQVAAGLPADQLPPELLNDVRRANYREITYEELVGVTDGLDQLVHLARMETRRLKGEKDESFAEDRDSLEQSIRDNNAAHKLPLEPGRRSEQRQSKIENAWASHAKIATLARIMDGGKDGGRMWDLIIRPLNAAADAKQQRNTLEGEAYQQIIRDHYKPGELLGEQAVFIPAIGDSLTREARLAVALNWGNDTSRERMLNDPVRRWSRQQIEAILETLDARDARFVQATWDYLDRFWPEIAAKQKRITGLEPEKVPASPTSWRTSDGQTVDLQGGYYPLKYDGRLAPRAGQLQAVGELKLATAAAYVNATTRRGHVEARKQSVTLPVRLELGVMFEHIDQVIHDLTHHEALIDVNRIIRDSRVSRAILETRGDVVYRQFTDALHDIAVGMAPSTNLMDKAAQWMRSRSQVAGLGLNFWTSLQQPLGLFNGTQRIGVKWMVKGFGRLFRDASTIKETMDWIARVSPFMAERTTTANTDLMEVRQQLTRATWWDEQIRKVTNDRVTMQQILDGYMWHIAIAQRIADVPTWLGAYEKAAADQANRTLTGELDEQRIVALADQAVIDSQGSGHVKDLASVQRGGQSARLWMTFYSYGNTVLNASMVPAMTTNYREPSQVLTMLGHMGLLYVAPALGTVLLSRAVGRTPNDDEGWVGLLKDAAWESLAGFLNTMVLVREASGAVQLALGAKDVRGTRGYEGPAGVRPIQLLYRFAGQVRQHKFDEAFFEALNAGLGAVYRYPATQVQRTVEGAIALEEGRTQNPLALLIGAPRSKERRK
jgi:hypothetical protein